LQKKVLQFCQQGKLIGAICHGIMVLARTVDPQTGRSVLYGHKVAAVPQSLDRSGYLLKVRLLRRSYLTYPYTVEAEVRPCLERPEDLSFGRSVLVPYVVCDGNLITARWYMDAELFSERFASALEQRTRQEK
jgi:putative intracellular protease/amidase